MNFVDPGLRHHAVVDGAVAELSVGLLTPFRPKLSTDSNGEERHYLAVERVDLTPVDGLDVLVVTVNVCVDCPPFLDVGTFGCVPPHILHEFSVEIDFDSPVGGESVSAIVTRDCSVLLALCVLRMKSPLPDLIDHLLPELLVPSLRGEERRRAGVRANQEVVGEGPLGFLIEWKESCTSRLVSFAVVRNHHRLLPVAE
ncbi:hypothetical protein HUG10_15785 [Halorarum halophilum]|uniref:Uncharacterized protein n=1 Tax=Halorarum halophilum TaxID=2743090 RepID=A0A7D5K9B4_9EURY|nr:hypothetical protein [Halobaculum halophilum]QLG28914.1 hypothetical protein HUG10_15785 [Halobaculum halophilum]